MNSVLSPSPHPFICALRLETAQRLIQDLAPNPIQDRRRETKLDLCQDPDLDPDLYLEISHLFYPEII